MKYKLYKLALWYIGKCNKEDTSYKSYKKIIKDLDKLTFRCFGKANLLYGLGAEWENFGRYDVLDNAIQRLAEYEELGTVEELKEAREKQVAKKPKHIHEEHERHQWRKKKNGEVDDWAWASGFCNGVVCERCGESICVHCNPNYDDEPCIVDKDLCPNCGKQVWSYEHKNYCSECGQALKWSEE